MSVDPLAEEYSYQSAYNFSENRVVDAIELEGLEAVVLSATKIEYHVNITNNFVKIEDHFSTEQIQVLTNEVSNILSQNGFEISVVQVINATVTIELNYPSVDIYENGALKSLTDGHAQLGNSQTAKIVSDGDPGTTAHGLGHTMGLPHIFKEGSTIPNTQENINNLMNSGGNHLDNNPDLRCNSTELKPSQSRKMIESVTQETFLPDMNGITIDSL